jgi:hypothetical protein
LLFCIAMGVFTTYLGIFMLVRQLRADPRPPLPPKPNFSARSATVVDPATGEKTIYREITVSTKFAPGSGSPPPASPAPTTP